MKPSKVLTPLAIFLTIAFLVHKIVSAEKKQGTSKFYINYSDRPQHPTTCGSPYLIQLLPVGNGLQKMIPVSIRWLPRLLTAQKLFFVIALLPS